MGLDFEQGKSVDVVVQPGQPLPLETDFADIIISSSQLEHDTEFWANLIEMYRVLKPGGVLYINTPSNGNYHPYPSDAWRFYPDAGKAFAKLGMRTNYPMTLLESFTAKRMTDQWNDFVCVLFKGEWPENRKLEYLSDIFECYNVWRLQAKEMSKRQALSEDQLIIEDLRSEVVRLRAKLSRRSERRLKNRVSRVLSRVGMKTRHWRVATIAWISKSRARGLDPFGSSANIEQKRL